MGETVYTPIIEQQRDAQQKEQNKNTMYQFYKSLYNPYSTKQQDLYVEALIHDLEETIEKCHYIYLNNFNDTESW